MKFSRVQKVAERYDCSVQTIWRWVRQGQLPKPVKLGPNTTAWAEEELDAHDQALAEARNAVA